MRLVQSVLRVLAVIALGAVFASLLAAQPVLAAGITVNSLADTTVSGDGQCTLREALNNVNAAADTTGGDCRAGTGTGDTISFSVTGTISLTAGNRTLMLTKNATIQGPGATALAVDGNNTATVFTMTSSTTASIGGLTVQHGSGNSGGGGIDNSGTLQVTDSIVAFNTSTGAGSFGGMGGGIASSGALTVVRSTVRNNVAAPGPLLSGSGGGIFSLGTLTLIDSTVVNNLARSDGNGFGGNGGGIATQTSATLIGSTVANNTAESVMGPAPASHGGGIYADEVNSGGTLTLTNTLVAGNSVDNIGSGPDIQNYGAAVAKYDLIGAGDGSSGLVNGSNGNLVGTTASPINPLLAPLGNNGGPTPTMALLLGSPAIDRIPDAGGCGVGILTDQRGLPRPSGSADLCDIGAFELQPAPLPQPKPPGPNPGSPAPVPAAPKPQGPNLGVPNPLPTPR